MASRGFGSSAELERYALLGKLVFSRATGVSLAFEPPPCEPCRVSPLRPATSQRPCCSSPCRYARCLPLTLAPSNSNDLVKDSPPTQQTPTFSPSSPQGKISIKEKNLQNGASHAWGARQAGRSDDDLAGRAGEEVSAGTSWLILLLALFCFFCLCGWDVSGMDRE